MFARHTKVKKKDEFFVDMNKFKELYVYMQDGEVSFDTEGLAQVEGYGMFDKERLEKIIQRIFRGEGVLKFKNGEKLDLTLQTEQPEIVYKPESVYKKY